MNDRNNSFLCPYKTAAEEVIQVQILLLLQLFRFLNLFHQHFFKDCSVEFFIF